MFKPKGERSRRSMAIDAIREREPDTVITYEELSDLLGLDRTGCQAVINQAKAGLERQHHRALIAVPNVGYRIVCAKEHLGLAQKHQGRSVRQLRKARSKVVNINAADLTPGERIAVDLAATALAAQLEYARQNDLRVTRLETVANLTATAQQRSEDDIKKMEERLARLEGLVS